MHILLDPTSTEFTRLEIAGRVFRFAQAKKDCGAAIIRQLSKLKISAQDELAVIVGPGNFTAIRTACLIANAVHFLTKCQLWAKRADENQFQKVGSLRPFYASEPQITLAKR
ncbi:MAG: hypothetical protein V1936_01135 [Patescibacteria group bacterium]